MTRKIITLICAVCAIALVSGSWVNAAIISDVDGKSSAAKLPKAEMVIAQAWWDAAYNAATAQRQATAPLVRSENRRYRRSFR